MLNGEIITVTKKVSITGLWFLQLRLLSLYEKGFQTLDSNASRMITNKSENPPEKKMSND